MAKRRPRFEDPEDEEEEEEEEEPPPPPRKRAAVAVGGPGSRFSGKPSLDSDEEDEEEEEDEGCGAGAKYDLLLPHGEEGEEAWPGGAGEGGGPPLTPFNLAEELAEGSFDPQGHYLPRRGGRRPPDPWLEAVDWMTIKPRPPPKEKQEEEDEDGAGGGEEGPSPPPLPLLLRGVLALLRPGETVGGALRRLGGVGGGKTEGGAPPRRPRPPPQLEELAELADGLVARGLFGIFQETRERLGLRLQNLGGGNDGPPQNPGSDPPPRPPPPSIFSPPTRRKRKESGQRRKVSGGGGRGGVWGAPPGFF
ncbi:CD2 antigen cytoplasmic tail-binding protein 2, partial [Haliaeetus albicilla]|uniref:CD2 antigen cytoplasmic tail-binding protein 2 n=1 Tax=Haliaeetus albicilla TaxID=8969 RepID=UPI0037E82406